MKENQERGGKSSERRVACFMMKTIIIHIISLLVFGFRNCSGSADHRLVFNAMQLYLLSH
ncbi:unnamed protein product, partial [Linum tenue]